MSKQHPITPIVGLGEVHKLEDEIVDQTAITQLEETIEYMRNPVFPFSCVACGAERDSLLQDPGPMMLREYKCSDVGMVCTSPARPRTTKKDVLFYPGCFVLAPFERPPEIGRPWPGMIEDCPDGTERYTIPGKDYWVTKAYFVTFIFPSGHPNFFGGYFKASTVQPLHTVDLHGLRSTDLYTQSLQRAYDNWNLSLVERLVRFSFVAHVARKRNIRLQYKRRRGNDDSDDDGHGKTARAGGGEAMSDDRGGARSRAPKAQRRRSPTSPLKYLLPSTLPSTTSGLFGPYLPRVHRPADDDSD